MMVTADIAATTCKPTHHLLHRILSDVRFCRYSSEHNEYYDTKHYLRITPHILADPVHAELPKMYSNGNEKEDVLYVAVSYFFDEDEYDGMFRYKRFVAEDLGDENEVKRGYYVAR